MAASSRAGGLKAFPDLPSRPADTFRYHELQGFLFTIACAPEMAPPSEWLPIVFGGDASRFANPKEAQEILGQIMELYNAINDTVVHPPAQLPADCTVREDVLANLDDDAPVAQWSRGFLQGHQWLEDLWEDLVPEGLDDELGSILMTLSFFSHSQTNMVTVYIGLAGGRGSSTRRPPPSRHTTNRSQRDAEDPIDRIIHDGDTVVLGVTTLTAHLTADYTPGYATWTMNVGENGRTYHVRLGCSLRPGVTVLPAVADQFARSFNPVRSLSCDVQLGDHGAPYGMQEKYATLEAGGANPFVERATCFREADIEDAMVRAILAGRGGGR